MRYFLLLPDVNGDRVADAFDYWGIVHENDVFRWKLAGNTNE